MSCTGPAENIGDSLIRRQVVRWTRSLPIEARFAYVGDNDDLWSRQLGIDTSFTVLKGKARAKDWVVQILRAPRRSVLVFEPGEVPLDAGNVVRELTFLALTIAIRLKGGTVVRPPRAVRKVARLPLLVHRLACRMSQVVLWRDEATLQLIGVGRTVPDVAVLEPPRSGQPAGGRHVLAVSLRGDRPHPGPDWLGAIATIAARHSLEVVVVTQVLEDTERSRVLAQELGAELIDFDSRDSVQQEAVLRDLYDSASVVVSDRLHVLILAALSGAAPVELVAQPQPKIGRNLARLGYPDASFDSSTPGATEFLDRQLGRGPEIVSRLAAARSELTSVLDAARRSLSA